MSKTLGLALGSGGSRGVAHIGILLALEEAGITPDYITGCSMGAVVGGCYASGMSVETMRDIALQIKARDIIDIGAGFVSGMGVLRTKKLEEMLSNLLGSQQIEDMKIPFRCVATELHSGKLHVFENGPAALAIRASSTIPCVFRPVISDDKMFVDGGCLCRVPVKQAKEMGADVVVAVDVLSNTSEEVENIGNILDLVLRVFDIMDAQQTQMHSALDGDIADIVIKPPMKGISQYAVKDLDKIFEEGYNLGKQYTDQIRDLLN